MSRTVVSDGAGGSGGGTTLAPSTGNWATGTFGTGQIMTFAGAGSYTFTIPAGTTSIRVRCFGAGGAGGSNTSYSGGAGGGFALGTYTVTAGSNHTVTVGAGGYDGGSGGTSSFGSLISATGGAGGSTNSSAKTGGIGSGGTVNYLGGGTQGTFSGGGGVACLFGPGNLGTYGSGGTSVPSAYTNLGDTGGAGGGMGKNSSVYTSTYKGFSLGTFGLILSGDLGNQSGSPEANSFSVSPAAIPTCVDMLGTGHGGVQSGGRGFGNNGGGGMGGNDNFPGQGGWPGGGGGCGGGSANWRNGADGCVVVEY